MCGEVGLCIWFYSRVTGDERPEAKAEAETETSWLKAVTLFSRCDMAVSKVENVDIVGRTALIAFVGLVGLVGLVT